MFDVGSGKRDRRGGQERLQRLEPVAQRAVLRHTRVVTALGPDAMRALVVRHIQTLARGIVGLVDQRRNRDRHAPDHHQEREERGERSAPKRAHHVDERSGARSACQCAGGPERLRDGRAALAALKSRCSRTGRPRAAAPVVTLIYCKVKLTVTVTMPSYGNGA